MSLMRDIRATRVDRGTVALWWLGQNGFLFKTPEGTVVATDLYLTDSCVGAVPGLDLSRRVPVLIRPEDVEADLYVCTHSHQDHADPETIERLRHKDTMQFVGPHRTSEIYRECGVESGRIACVYAGQEIEIRDVTMRATFAMPTDDTDLNHVGYVFTFGDGPRVYMTGDTAACELLASAASARPQYMITVINGGFKNLSHDQAALLAAEIRPKAAIPCHYDMFPDNCCDPRQFRAALNLRAPDVEYRCPRHGEKTVLEG